MTRDQRKAAALLRARQFTRAGQMIVTIAALRSMTDVRLFLDATDTERQVMPVAVQATIIAEADHRRGELADSLYREATHA